jgi:HAD superfamily hydrolase (TIGR01549 family)
MPRNRKNIVFDLDGTILSSTPFYHAILESIFQKNGLSLTDEDKALASGLSAKTFLSPRLSQQSLDDALRYLVEQSERDLHEIPVFEGFYELLHLLKQRGCRLAVWTSRDRDSALTLLKKNSLDHYFDLVIAADCVSKHKPDPEGLSRISDQFGCGMEDVLMIGDHDVDVLAARAAGAMIIRANWHGFRVGQTCNLGSITAHSVAELADYLS